MARTIAQRELRNDNAKIMDAVAGGEEFIVTRHGAPIARITPIRPGKRTIVPRAELREILAGSERVDARRFRADLDEAVDQTRFDPYEPR